MLEAAAAVTVVTGYFLLVGYFLARESNWRDLSRAFPDTRSNRPDTTVSGRGRIGGINFNGMLHIDVDASGIAVGVWLPYRFFLPTLYIPWLAIQSISPQESMVFKQTPKSLAAAKRRLRKFHYVKIRLQESGKKDLLIPWGNDFYLEVPSALRKELVKGKEKIGV